MKQRVAALLAALLLALSLTACGGGMAAAESCAESSDAPSMQTHQDSGAIRKRSSCTVPEKTVLAAEKPQQTVQDDGETAVANRPEESAAPAEQPEENTAVPAADSYTLGVDCSNALSSDALSDSLRALLPADGVLCRETTLTLAENDTALSVLQRQMKTLGIPMEVSGGYVEGIGNLYQFDCGDESGWLYRVNGKTPMVGAGQCTLAPGDSVAWVYTCSMGDVG